MAVAALITWIIAAGFGLLMLGTWLRYGGTRAAPVSRATASDSSSAATADGAATSGGAGRTHFPPAVVFGHFLVAVLGLILWVIYLATDSGALAWVAFVVLLLVAGLGDVLVLRWSKDRRAAPARGSPAAGAPRAADLAEQHIPPVLVGLHGVFAVATLALVLLTALGIGS